MADQYEVLESLALQESVETEILDKCRQSPNGATNMAELLADKRSHIAMPGIYLMAAMNLCSQGKVRVQQKGQHLTEDASTADNLIITLLN
ncbi:GH17692 [Drosophila grimshawi]|uniref:GH17692 n=2 Tax=Drosophila grimshawi TaxID=7222 RepID=B4JWT8_DROGR|nr:GH17692 [Drosophila grimshawi]